ncbi:MAG TPA: selenocysteine-specific translation elongation factor [Candidatus Acidoferrales bacterium]|jgi:selenocysteine-specific elongation factor|nr:selenocysteine-specific translation elongation factor [Candidatus Acidoferrales bacterium]
MKISDPSTRHVIVGTAGHIDHGKSTLVEALTGTHPDRLEEEKRRGITIDLGFAFLNLDGVSIGFVDVPGHEKFVRNMLAGAGGIDVVVLVVAADEAIKPQTREHFEICEMLGISRGVVAITKADLVDREALGLVKLEIEEFVRGSFLEGAAIVPVSARTGAGLDSLKTELLRAAQAAPKKDALRYLRLPIDRSFAMKGFGTVVTGTLVAGSVKIDDEVELYPTGRRLRVRGLHSGGASVERAMAGQRTAVNLVGIDHADIARGMSLAPAGIFEPTDRLDARITVLASAKRLKNRAHVHFHQGTAETIAEVVLLEGEELGPGASGFAQLRLKEKALLLPGDRFILRQFSPVVTIGGGVVLDVKPERHKRTDAGVTPALQILARGNREEILLAVTQRSKTGAMSVRAIVARTGWTKPEIEAEAQALGAAGKLRGVSEPQQPLVLASSRAVAECSAAVRAAVEKFHRENPLLPGIPRQELHTKCGNPRAELFDASLGDLLKAGVLSVTGDLVQRTGRTMSLAPEEERAKQLIEREFEAAGLAVPSLAMVLAKLPVEAQRAQKILQILLREQVLVRVTAELIFHRAAVARLRELLAGYRKTKGAKLPVPAFKELTGVTRKYAIPLLEYLDRQQVTRRVGDERVIL